MDYVVGDSYEVGAWYEMGRTVYVYVNKQGTVRKFNRVPWYKIIALAYLQFFGKKKHLEEVLEFLRDKRWDM